GSKKSVLPRSTRSLVIGAPGVAMSAGSGWNTACACFKRAASLSAATAGGTLNINPNPTIHARSLLIGFCPFPNRSLQRCLKDREIATNLLNLLSDVACDRIDLQCDLLSVALACLYLPGAVIEIHFGDRLQPLVLHCLDDLREGFAVGWRQVVRE